MNKKILLVSCLVLWLLPGPRVFALEDTSRMDILEAKVNTLEKKTKASDAKRDALESKMALLESRLNTSDSKIAYLLRLDTQLESRVGDLEAAQIERKSSGNKEKKRIISERPAEVI